MKVLIVLAALVAAASCLLSEEHLSSQWHSFKASHGKRYASPAEEVRRSRIFRQNAIQIAEHNARFEAGEVSFTMGVNQFSDLTPEEFSAGFATGARSGKRAESTGARLHDPKADAETRWPYGDDHVDWRWMGWVTKVKNQGDCNSCWAFSTTGAVESAYAQQNGYQVLLSEQNLLDCAVTAQYPNSCPKGGWIAADYDYAQNEGIVMVPAYADYTVPAKQEACRREEGSPVVKISGRVVLKQDSEDDLKDAVYKIGPVSVHVDANVTSFMHYRSGIYYDPECRSDTYTHSVLAVGYGTEYDSEGNPTDYWIVKNQWGDEWWGENGYFRLARNRGSHCAIARYALYPLL